MIKLTGISQLVPVHYGLNKVRIATLAGRKICVPSSTGSRTNSLFFLGINSHPISNKRMAQVRWQTSSTAENHGQENQQKSTKSKLKNAATLGLGGSIGVALKYVYDNPPGEGWPTWMGGMLKVRHQARKDEIEHAYKDFTFVREVLTAMSNLKKTKDGQDFETHYEKMIKNIEKRQAEAEISLKVERMEYAQERVSHKDRLEKLSKDHANELAQKQAEAGALLKTEKEERTQDLSIHKQQLENLSKHHADELHQLAQKHKNEIEDYPKLKLKEQLYDQCPAAELQDLHKYFSSKGSISYLGGTFNPHLLDLLGQALTANLNNSATELNFTGSKISSGFNYIISGLKKDTIIKSLHLKNTDLQLSDFPAIVGLLEYNQTLQLIDLSGLFFIDDTQAEYLLNVLRNKQDRSITKIILRNTKVTTTKKKELQDTLKISIE